MNDNATGEPVACRVHLKGADGKSHRAEGLPYWRDHFVCPGTVRLKLPEGTYTYEVERGPEYRAATGSFSVKGDRVTRQTIEIERLANLAAEGWWSGDLHVHRPAEEIELLMQAEDLHIAPVITWWNNRNLWSERPIPDRLLVPFDSNRYYHVMAGEDEREGGALLYFHLARPLPIAGAGREHPSPMRFLLDARREPGAWIDIEKPFWWDVPVWLASGQVDSIGLANNHMCRDQMYETEAWGKPRDARRLPPPLGNGLWSQELYYHILNTGLRIPPSAGSASGVLPNPVGYNRVYSFVERDFTYESWWESVRAGRCFVTNGPLLRVRANAELPGHVFTAGEDEAVDLTVTVQLASRDPVRSIEIIRNGQVDRLITVDPVTQTGRQPLRFAESGWFLVRAIADNDQTFRFASTAPFYVEIGAGKRRVSKKSAQFFLDWVNERMERVRLEDPEQRREVLEYHRTAKQFWEDRVGMANAD